MFKHICYWKIGVIFMYLIITNGTLETQAVKFYSKERILELRLFLTIDLWIQK